MVQERSVDGFADGIVATKTETDIRHTAGNFGTGADFFDLLRCFKKVYRVIVVLTHPSRNRKDVRVEDDVLGWETDLFDQDVVGTLADTNFVVRFDRLSFFVKRHHNGSRSVATDKTCAFKELGFAFFQADRVHDRFALDVSQAGFDNGPFTAVDHNRNARDIRFAGD